MHIFQSTLSNIIGDELNVLHIFDTPSQGVFIIDSDGKCNYANPACERQFGFTKHGKLIGKNLEQVIDQNVPEGALKSEKGSRIEQVVPNNEHIYVENKLILRPDGTTFLADYWSYPIKRDGRPIGNLIILNEVGDRLDIHQQLAELARFPDMNQGIEIIKEYDRNLPQVQVQSSELNQVWTSIIDNAVYAINGPGKIVIRTFKKNKWLIVQIKDTGTGIPVDVQSQIFDPLFTTKAPGDGAGLSLSLSHNINVQKHKGKLSVKSVPGETCFEIKLPLKK
jgi:PAS domain S-box-containing protein